MSEPFMVTEKRPRELPAPDLSKRSEWMIGREEIVQKGFDGFANSLDALEEIRKHPEEYHRLGYKKFNDYTTGRWRLSADRIWQKLKWHRDWLNMIVPELENRQLSVPPEGAGREFTKLAKEDKPAAAQAIAKESAPTG